MTSESDASPAQRVIGYLPLAVALVILAAAGFVVWEASGFRLGARLFPLYVGIAAILLALAEVGSQILARRRPVSEGLLEEPATADLAADALERTPAFYRLGLYFFGWFLALYALSAAIGFFYAVPLWVLAFLRLRFGAAWLTSLGLALGLFAMVYLLRITLQMRVPPGVLPLPF